jgi:hypothetical protein
MNINDLIKGNCKVNGVFSFEELKKKVSRFNKEKLILCFISYLNDMPESCFKESKQFKYLKKLPFSAAHLLAWIVDIDFKGYIIPNEKDVIKLVAYHHGLSASAMFLSRMNLSPEWYLRAVAYQQFRFQSPVDEFAPARFLKLFEYSNSNCIFSSFVKNTFNFDLIDIASFQFLMMHSGDFLIDSDESLFLFLIDKYNNLLQYVTSYDDSDISNYKFKFPLSLEGYYFDPVFVERPILRLGGEYYPSSPYFIRMSGEFFSYDFSKRNIPEEINNHIFSKFEKYVAEILKFSKVPFVNGKDKVLNGKDCDFLIGFDKNKTIAVEVKGGAIVEDARGAGFSNTLYSKLKNHVVKAVEQIYSTVSFLDKSDFKPIGLIVTLRPVHIRDALKLSELIGEKFTSGKLWDTEYFPLNRILICTIQEFEIMMESNSDENLWDFLNTYIHSNELSDSSSFGIGQVLPSRNGCPDYLVSCQDRIINHIESALKS